ncbi:MAG: pentapeptide repeat-containing protein [Syntrophaceae bacterium]|nr:pentapeptide repeat-containing protein [Syntrophaceae bacterium]
MPCCYKDGKEWCQDLETVYTDAEGNEYCVFHAPQGKKGESLEAFNELVFARIQEAQQHHKRCDLSGTIFEGDVSFHQFDKNEPLPEIDFSEAQFSGKANFWFTKFSEYADFRFAQFSEDAEFLNAKFSGYADFWNTKFSGYADFMSAQFSGDGNFAEAQFSGHGNFAEVQFSGDGNFAEAQFSGGADFDFIRIPEKGLLMFRSTDRIKTFGKKASFRNLDIEGSLVFEGVDLSTALFYGTRVQKIDFINVRWRRSGPRGWRNTLYDEIFFFERIKKGPSSDVERPGTPPTDFKNLIGRTFCYADKYGDDIRKVGILYRRMKNKYRTLQNWPEVSNWHYGEKEMYRKENAFRRYFPFSFSFLYWLSSGYGERYVRAGVVLAALIFLLSFGLAWTGLNAAGASGSHLTDFHGITSITIETLNLKSIGALLINTLKYATFQKDIIFFPRNMWGEIVRLLTQILIPIQTALFIMAVRNRFRR